MAFHNPNDNLVRLSGDGNNPDHLQGTVNMKRLLLALFLLPILIHAEGHRVLAADSSKRLIGIVAADGTLEWKYQLQGGIHDLDFLPNGNIMLQAGMQSVQELDPKTEKIIWEYQANPLKGERVEIHAFQRLANGDTMIAESGRGRIIEVNNDGKIVKEFKMKLDRPDAHRDTRLARKLDDGHYLVAHEGDGFVREYDKDGKLFWEFEVPLFGKQSKGGHGVEAFGNSVFGILKLKNGNILVGSGNGHSILEVSRDKEIVWQIHQDDLPGIQLAWVTTLQELPSGNIIIGNCHAGPDNPQILEVTREKKVVWTFKDFKNFGNSLSNSMVLPGSKEATIGANKSGISIAKEAGPAGFDPKLDFKKVDDLQSPVLAFLKGKDIFLSGLKPSGSHVWEADTYAALNDGAEIRKSMDHSIKRHTWWPNLGTTEYVQYDFTTPEAVAGVDVYWYDDTTRGRCRVPQKWQLKYKKDDTWVPVETAADYGTGIDRFHRVTFKPINTNALRIEVQLQDHMSGGVLEWRVIKSPPDPVTAVEMGTLKTSELDSTLSLSATTRALIAPVEGLSEEAKTAFFEKQVFPIIEKNCFKCHRDDPENLKAHLWLGSREGILKGGDVGPVVDLVNPASSHILKMINYVDDGHQMPPTGKLPANQIATLARWVELGVPWKKDLEHKMPESRAPVSTTQVNEHTRNYWCYKKLVRPELPKVKNAEWVTSPIDNFILAKLEAIGLQPNGPADKLALIRRAYFDLIGLPPAPAEVDAFLKDTSPNAFEQVIDDLLQRPQYGEKWGRHWLDNVRYAETHGYERDSTKPFAWRYRDYVIKAFNEDKGYDQFIIEQIAGDEIENPSTDAVIATGYYRLGVWDDEPVDRKLQKYDILDGVVSTTAQTMLGMTVGCARCHNHKKDPIPQSDYYRLVAFFHDIRDMDRQNLITMQDAGASKEREKELAAKATHEESLYGQIYKFQEEFKAAILEDIEKADITISQLPESDMLDLSYKFYRDTFETLPKNFKDLRHENEGRIANNYFSLEPATRKEAIGLVFEGKLRVPADGEYTFHLETTEGSRLIIDDNQIDEKVAKGAHKRDAKATLKKGLLPIKLEFFNTYEKPVLKVAWSGPGIPRKFLTEELTPSKSANIMTDARKQEDGTKIQDELWWATEKKPAGDWMQPNFNPADWKQSQGGFGSKGTPGSIVRTDWLSKDIWLRRNFTLTKLPGSLNLNLHHDEDAEIYINGVQVATVQNYTTGYEQLKLGGPAVSALTLGKNVIAIHCHQTGGGQYIDAGLVSASGEVNIAALINQHGQNVMGEAKTKQYLKWQADLDKSLKTKFELPGIKVMGVQESGGNSTVHLLQRGNPHLEGEIVTPGYPSVLGFPDPELPKTIKNGTSGKRTILASWITSKENPLTARVMMNRVWQHHFGRGIVRTSSDFGQLGDQPTHEELLNWLAAEFMERNWKLKTMHKFIMLSSTYRMSSGMTTASYDKDPGNNLFWSFDMRRLAAEELRDAVYAVNGSINFKMGGESFFSAIPAEVLQGASRPGAAWGRSSPEEQARRTVYNFVKRSVSDPFLASHDSADTDQPCAVRFVTTVPTQSLIMLNSEFMNSQAKVFAERLKKEAGEKEEDQIRHAFKLAFAREPKASEVSKSIALLNAFKTEDGLSPDQALAQFCLMSLNLNEFAYLD